MKTDCDTLHVYVHVYEHDIELLILSFCYIISMFHYEAISSFLELKELSHGILSYCGHLQHYL